MEVFIALTASFIVGLFSLLKTKSAILAWLIASLVMPAFVLCGEFLIPYQGGGASMWPIALIVGGVIGFISGGLGVGVGVYVLKLKKS